MIVLKGNFVWKRIQKKSLYGFIFFLLFFKNGKLGKENTSIYLTLLFKLFDCWNQEIMRAIKTRLLGLITFASFNWLPIANRTES